jgi:hypothetical protein
MRESYQFRYVWANGTVAAVSNEVKVKQNQPMQGHLQLTNEISQMRVMWVQGTTPSDSIVLYYQKTQNISRLQPEQVLRTVWTTSKPVR